MTPLGTLRAAVNDAARDLTNNDEISNLNVTLERPPKPDFGDYSTNAALLLAPKLKQNPREVASSLSSALTERLSGAIERVEVAGPGFVNLFLTDDWYQQVLAQVLQAGDAFGHGSADSPERILIEFVSANPTGPLTAAGGRHAAYGDALARVLEFHGHTVGREYYVNDAGGQVDHLGASIKAHALGEEVPADGYQGEYVAELAKQIPDAGEFSIKELGRRGSDLLVDRIKASLHAFRVDFDTWFSERRLREGEPNEIEIAFERLREHGHVYESEGALWVRTTDWDDDKDRVVRRSNGDLTYFAPDIAYHLDKRERGWERLIDVLGSDHHGYVARIKAAYAALGEDPDKLEPIIMQFVNVIDHGKRASISKRRGDFVTLDEVIADIGVDATRFFMLQRSHDTTVDLDLDLAREQSSENPVYYVQYAHARIASILNKAGVSDEFDGSASDVGIELHPAERHLIKKLAAFPGEVDEAANRRAPHRITVYALELAQDFTAFYRDCRVVGAEPAELETFRLGLALASKRVIARSLDLLGVSAPEAM